MEKKVLEKIKKSGVDPMVPDFIFVKDEAKDIAPGIFDKLSESQPKLETIIPIKQRKWKVEFSVISEKEHWNISEIIKEDNEIFNIVKIDPNVVYIIVMATCAIQALSNNLVKLKEALPGYKITYSPTEQHLKDYFKI